MPHFLTSSLKGKMALGFGAVHLLLYLFFLSVLASGDDAAIGLAFILLMFGGGGMQVFSAASLQEALLDSHRAESAAAASGARPTEAQALARKWRWPLVLGGAVLLIGGLGLARVASGPAFLAVVAAGVTCLVYGVTFLTPLPDSRPGSGPWGAAKDGAATVAGRDRIRLGLRAGMIGARALGPREAKAVIRLAGRLGLRHLARKLLRRLPEPLRRVLSPSPSMLIGVVMAFLAVQVLAMLLTRFTPLPRGGALAPAVSAALLGTIAVAIWLRRRRDGGG